MAAVKRIDSGTDLTWGARVRCFDSLLCQLHYADRSTRRACGRAIGYASRMTGFRHPARQTPRSSALTAALIACLLLLPALRATGELHHAVAHTEHAERSVHSTHVHSGGATAEHSEQASVLHDLMHLPAASADIVALAYPCVAIAVTLFPAASPAMQPSARNKTTAPDLPYRPPMLS